MLAMLAITRLQSPHWEHYRVPNSNYSVSIYCQPHFHQTPLTTGSCRLWIFKKCEDSMCYVRLEDYKVAVVCGLIMFHWWDLITQCDIDVIWNDQYSDHVTGQTAHDLITHTDVTQLKVITRALSGESSPHLPEKYHLMVGLGDSLFRVSQTLAFTNHCHMQANEPTLINEIKEEEVVNGDWWGVWGCVRVLADDRHSITQPHTESKHPATAQSPATSLGPVSMDWRLWWQSHVTLATWYHLQVTDYFTCATSKKVQSTRAG